MMKKILVCTDLSSASEALFRCIDEFNRVDRERLEDLAMRL